MTGIRENTVKFLSWLQAIWSWLREPQHFWLGVVIVGFALAFSLRRGVTEPEIRYTGMALQLLGVGTVIFGIRDTRKLFELPGVVDWTRAWLRRIPVFGGRVVNISGHATGAAFGVAGRLHGTVSAPPGATVEQRLNALEQDAKLVKARMDHVEKEMDRKFRDHEAKLRQEQEERTREVQRINLRQMAAHTGGLSISLLGAWFLLVGVALSAFAPDLCRWLG